MVCVAIGHGPHIKDLNLESVGNGRNKVHRDRRPIQQEHAKLHVYTFGQMLTQRASQQWNVALADGDYETIPIVLIRRWRGSATGNSS